MTRFHWSRKSRDSCPTSSASSSFKCNKEEWQSSGSSRSSRNELADFQIQQIITSTPKNTVTQDSTKNQVQKYGTALGKNQDTLCTAETIGEHFLRITYEEVKESSYSAEVVIKTLSNSRRECYDLNCLSEHLTRELDINNYIPIEHGYTITEIFKAGNVFLKENTRLLRITRTVVHSNIYTPKPCNKINLALFFTILLKFGVTTKILSLLVLLHPGT